MDDNNVRVDHLEKAMLGLADNQETLFLKINALADYVTKVMHSKATTLFFLQGNIEECEHGKMSDDTHSLHCFLAKDLLKTTKGHSRKVEENQAKADLDEGLQDKSYVKEGNKVPYFLFYVFSSYG